MTPDPVAALQTRRKPLLRFAALAAIVAASLCIWSPAFSQAAAEDKVVARVNGVEIKESDIVLADQDIGQGIPANDPQKKRDYLINYLSDMALLVREAGKNKFGDDPELNRRIAFEQNKILMEAVLARRGQAAINEPALREAYLEAQTRAASEIEFRIRDILFIVDPADKNAAAAENKAKAAMKRIQAGEDFAIVATELTESPTGKKNGGDLGYLAKRQMSDPVYGAVVSLEQGKVSAPIKSDNGWHIIKLEDKRARQIPAFDVSEVRGELEAYVYRKAQFEFITKLRSEAKIEQFDK